jgi:hypothetical protein
MDLCPDLRPERHSARPPPGLKWRQHQPDMLWSPNGVNFGTWRSSASDDARLAGAKKESDEIGRTNPARDGKLFPSVREDSTSAARQ